ncbi:uroporphyrinogen-III synthase [Psychromonas sp. B3M02]|uniref:uroporphyrinogen-III synthase n=1 Tax=Psychromonas sp. B3M02 TaxID=2267226 RepID=UPI000DE8AB14|nr:uroporphyrinogen-III synthase [Psychromonas sp. B3M02]RBW41586.1 uroporphyrinogen-III synthase [Psychromonas sp. B3M02]
MICNDRLLITRFAPYAQQLVDALSEVGCFSIAQPLLTVVGLNDPHTLGAFLSGQYDVVIAVSGNAVKYAQDNIIGEWPNAEYYAVGESTKESLRLACKQRVMCPFSRFDSEGLLALDALQDVAGKRILILRGEGGRDLLENSLIERGAQVDFFQTYKRVKLDLDGIHLVNYWQQASINGAIISSVEILNQLFVLVPKEYTSWLCRLTFYVPSQRVADQARSLGVENIILLPSLQTNQIVDFFHNK